MQTKTNYWREEETWYILQKSPHQNEGNHFALVSQLWANCCWIIVFHRGQISQTQIKGITEFILLTQTINGEILTYKNMHLSFNLNIEQNVPQYKTAKWLKQLLSKIHTYNLWTWSVRHIWSIFTRLKFVTRQGVYSHAGCCVRLC